MQQFDLFLERIPTQLHLPREPDVSGHVVPNLQQAKICDWVRLSRRPQKERAGTSIHVARARPLALQPSSAVRFPPACDDVTPRAAR